MFAAQGDQPRGEVEQFRIGRRPVQPAGRIVLGVGVVVTALALAHLGAHAQHRRAAREQQAGQQGALVAQPPGLDRRIVRRPLDAAVPGAIVVHPVAVALAVGQVVLGLVGHKVGQGEAVVGCDEVDAARGRAAVEHVLRPGKAPRQHAEGKAVAAPEAAQVVAEAVVPLAPMGWKAAELIAARADVPRLGDEFQAAQLRVLIDRGEDGRMRIETVRSPRQCGGQVKAETRDPAKPAPGPQGVHRQAQRGRLLHRQGIPGAGVVDVVGGVVRGQAVVAGVIQAAQRDGGAERIAFARVVEHHVDQGLDAGVGQGADRRAHLAPAAGGEPGIGDHEGDGVIAPVVRQAERPQVPFVDPGRAGHQLDGGDAQPLQVVDRHRVGEAGEGAANVVRNVRMGLGEAAHVQFVDDAHAPGDGQVWRCGPVGAQGRGDGLWDVRAAVALAAAHRGMQVERPIERQGVGIDQQLVGIEPVALGRIERAMGAQPIAGAFADTLDMAVEHRAGAAGQRDAGLLELAGLVVEAKLDGGGVGGPDGDVQPGFSERGAQRLGRAVGDRARRHLRPPARRSSPGRGRRIAWPGRARRHRQPCRWPAAEPRQTARGKGRRCAGWRFPASGR